uniref:HMG box domain-containing protein n=1 Tax=Caenorhabditis tropicalis TaxID=1561998 RepID=A0A1I7TLY3_9PELO
MNIKQERPDGGYGPTTFNLDQKPSTSAGPSGALGSHEGLQPGMNPNNFAQHAPGVRTAIARSSSQNDTPDRYQFSARWEEDEPAGLSATTAAVLYANERHPKLKESHPVWSERVKQIQKLWRNLSSEDRQEYVNRARDNRTKSGSKPRPRRNNAQSTNSVDSPTIQSSAPHQFGFKVPTNPGNPALSSMPSSSFAPRPPSQPSSSSNVFGSSDQLPQSKQIAITCELNPKDYQHYQELKRSKLDRERLIVSLEEQLNKARKQKKNLAAKKRQMVKTQMAAPDYDGHTIDLNDVDQQIFVQLTDHIKATQAEMENSKRNLKTHEGILRSFEDSHNVLRMECNVTPRMIELTKLRDQQYANHAEQMLAQQGQAQGLGQIPHHGPMGGQVSVPLPLLQQQQQQRMMHMQGMMRPGPGPFMIRQQPGGQQMLIQQQQEMHRRMMLHQMRQIRPVLGGVRYDEITDPTMKDAYECLDAMLFDVHQHVESQRDPQNGPPHGPPHGHPHGPHHPHMLQRMMQHPGGPPGPRLIMPGHLPPGQIPQLHPGPPMGQQPPPITPQSAQPTLPSEDGPKPKKKRTQQKKTTTGLTIGNEYDTWIETIRARFRLCPKIPKIQREPRLNQTGCEFVKHGLTRMSVVRQRKPLIGEFGAMSVRGGTRMFGNEERNKKVLTFNDVNLYQVEPQIRVMALYNNPMPPSEDTVLQDEMDVNVSLNPNSVLQRMFNKRQVSRDHIRTRARYNDESKAPVDPERNMFYQELEEEEDVTVELVFNTNDITQESSEEEKKDLCHKLQEQIRDLLAIKEEVPWKMEDTPPESPASISPEPEASYGVRQTTSTSRASRAPSASVEKEIKREEDEDMPLAHVLREVKREEIDSSQPHECKNCHKVIGVVSTELRFKMDKLGVLPTEATIEEKEEVASFCSKKCYYEFMSDSRNALTHEELNVAESHVSEEIYNKLKQTLSESIVKAINQRQKPPAPSTSSSSLFGNAELLISPKDTRYMMDEGKRESITLVPVSSLIGAAESKKETPCPQIAAGKDWKTYTKDICDSFDDIENENKRATLEPKLGVPHPPYELDKRICVFCGSVGDGETSGCGRLISLTEYYWVHVNCALWSSEVFENTKDGSLTNVDHAVVRAAQTACNHCKRPGASVKCHKMACGTNYHILCALENNGYLIKDKTFICKLHDKVPNHVIMHQIDALRKVYVKRDENSMLMRLFDLSEGSKLCLRLGAFTFYKLGSVSPKQIKFLHNKEYIFPNGYRVTRLFWSPDKYQERMLFECSIECENEDNALPVFRVKSLEDKNMTMYRILQQEHGKRYLVASRNYEKSIKESN